MPGYAIAERGNCQAKWIQQFSLCYWVLLFQLGFGYNPSGWVDVQDRIDCVVIRESSNEVRLKLNL